jgi:heparosan-N-sulfate-glucuronate 5-epimerase
MLCGAGVPVSTQWSPQGYFYPTQIAQYALSHYSKYLRVGDSGAAGVEPIVIEDAEDQTTSRWTSKGGSTVRNVVDSDVQSRVIEFRSSGMYRLTLNNFMSHLSVFSI